MTPRSSPAVGCRRAVVARRRAGSWPFAASASRLRTLGLGVLMAMAAASVSTASPAIVLRDDRGVVHRFSQPPQRVVTLLPSLTEAVCAVGACQRLVGTDRYSNWPPSVVALPKLGGLDDAVVETIVALAPDVVLAAESTRALQRLESLGLKVLAFRSDRHDQVHSTVLRLGVLFDAPAAAEQAWAQVQRELQQAAALVPEGWRGRRVYFEVDAAPYAASASSFVGQTLAQLGLVNIATGDMGAFPRLNPEFVVKSQPALIIAAPRNLMQMPQRPGWRPLEALRDGRRCVFDDAEYELLIRPGPRLGQAAQAIARCLVTLPPPAVR